MLIRKVKTRFERTGRGMWINEVTHFYKFQDFMKKRGKSMKKTFKRMKIGRERDSLFNL